MVRIDSTVTEAPIHEPSDSSLLWDSVRVMVRLLVQVMGLPGAPFIAWRNHSLVAKRRARQIMYTRGQDKKAKLYKALVKVCRETLLYLQRAIGADNKGRTWPGMGSLGCSSEPLCTVD